mgnify:CR=1 FL=1
MAYLKNRGLESEKNDEDLGLVSGAEKRCGHSAWAKTLVVILAVVILGGLGYLTAAKFLSSDNIAQVSNDWQAVFLSNGQVYFGKVKAIGGETLTLNDIYYLQVVTKPLQTTEVGAAGQPQTQQELTLIKLGNEIHGPTDAMTINRDQVLLTEKLKKDSRVVQAIDNYLKEQAKK